MPPVRAAAVAVLLLHCCGVMILVLAARPLLPPAAGEDGGWQLRHDGAGASSSMILQVLDKNNAPSQPGQGNNCDWQGPGHPKGSCPPPS